MQYDMLVIGAGPGGYVAAIRGAQLGLKVCVVEKANVGGVCLNQGCIPTKALLRAAEAYYHMKNAHHFGISCKDITVDLSKMVQHSQNVISKLTGGVKHLLNKNKVEVVYGHAKIKGSHKVVVDDKIEIDARNIVIATGAKVRLLPGVSLSKHVWSYKEAIAPQFIPQKLLVIGAGAIGVEFASFYNMLGSSVTIIEVCSQMLPLEDAEISEHCLKAFQKRGMDVRLKTTLLKLEEKGGLVKVQVEHNGSKAELAVDAVISATGITPNVQDIGLESTKVQLEKNFIKTDQWLQTTHDGIYAIGDVTAPPWLAHKASHEGVTCAEHIAQRCGKKVAHISTLCREAIPSCTYSYPQVASIGLTEVAAKSAGYDVKIGRFPFSANGKAIAMLEESGFVKVIFEAKTGELLGAHMVGPEVTELIQSYSVAKHGELTIDELIHTISPHPTLSEALHEAVLDAANRAVHI